VDIVLGRRNRVPVRQHPRLVGKPRGAVKVAVLGVTGSVELPRPGRAAGGVQGASGVDVSLEGAVRRGGIECKDGTVEGASPAIIIGLIVGDDSSAGWMGDAEVL